MRTQGHLASVIGARKISYCPVCFIALDLNVIGMMKSLYSLNYSFSPFLQLHSRFLSPHQGRLGCLDSLSMWESDCGGQKKLGLFPNPLEY